MKRIGFKMSVKARGTVFCGLFLILTQVSRAELLMQPYLQDAGQTSIYVLAECDSKTMPAMVQYGKTTSYGLSVTAQSADTTTRPSFVQKIKISGLIPGTKYHYRAVHGGSVSPDYTFMTASGDDAAFSFAFMADSQENTRAHGDIARLISAALPDFSVYGGDLCSSGDYNSFKNEFFIQPELDLISFIPFYLAPGNHEGWSQNTKAFTKAPLTGQDGYFSFDRGSAHFIILNTEADFGTGSPQYEFAREDLASTNKKWKIAVFHKPAYAQGGDWWGFPNPTREIADNVLSPAGVQLTLSGHMHYYQHNYSKGTHHLVISSAGGYLENPVPDSYTIKGDKGYHYAIVDVNSLSLCVRVYNDAGAQVDTVCLP